MTSLAITLPWPSSALSPNGGVARWDQIKATKAAKNYAWAMTIELMGPLGIVRGSWRGPIAVTYTFHAKNDRGRDDDNFIRRMKPARDGIAMALGVDDKLFNLQPVVWGSKRNGTVEIMIVPAEVSVPFRGWVT